MYFSCSLTFPPPGSDLGPSRPQIEKIMTLIGAGIELSRDQHYATPGEVTSPDIHTVQHCSRVLNQPINREDRQNLLSVGQTSASAAFPRASFRHLFFPHHSSFVMHISSPHFYEDLLTELLSTASFLHNKFICVTSTPQRTGRGGKISPALFKLQTTFNSKEPKQSGSGF